MKDKLQRLRNFIQSQLVKESYNQKKREKIEEIIQYILVLIEKKFDEKTCITKLGYMIDNSEDLVKNIFHYWNSIKPENNASISSEEKRHKESQSQSEEEHNNKKRRLKQRYEETDFKKNSYKKQKKGWKDSSSRSRSSSFIMEHSKYNNENQKSRYYRRRKGKSESNNRHSGSEAKEKNEFSKSDLKQNENEKSNNSKFQKEAQDSKNRNQQKSSRSNSLQDEIQKEEDPQKVTQQQQKIRSNAERHIVRIKELPQELQSFEILHEKFKKYGEIKQIQIDKQEAFIRFYSTENAQKARSELSMILGTQSAFSKKGHRVLQTQQLEKKKQQFQIKQQLKVAKSEFDKTKTVVIKNLLNYLNTNKEKLNEQQRQQILKKIEQLKQQYAI